MSITIFIIGCIWATFGLILNTKNFKSALLFKVFPLFSGIFTMYYAATILHWI